MKSNNPLTNWEQCVNTLGSGRGRLLQDYADTFKIQHRVTMHQKIKENLWNVANGKIIMIAQLFFILCIWWLFIGDMCTMQLNHMRHLVVSLHKYDLSVHTLFISNVPLWKMMFTIIIMSNLKKPKQRQRSCPYFPSYRRPFTPW